MPAEERTASSAVGVGAVGVSAGQQEGILAELSRGDGLEFVAFSDEGLEEDRVGDSEVSYYADYNMLLHDPAVELVLVDGPVEKRRDLAVRALNAGRHVVIRQPFCETVVDAERVVKTARRAGLIVTMDLPWRDDPDLRALQTALAAENVEAVHGLLCFHCTEDLPHAGEPGQGLLAQVGAALLGPMHLLLKGDVKHVQAHVQVAGVGGPEIGFLIYLSVRQGGWGISRTSRYAAVGLPRWVLYTSHAAFTATGGKAHVVANDQVRTYEASGPAEDFWQNLHAAIRDGAELKCHPVDIVRAMKLHEAALESVALGEPVTV